MIRTVTIPGASKEGLLPWLALAEQARSQTEDVFAGVYAFPALYVIDISVDAPAASESEDTKPAAPPQLMTQLHTNATALRYLNTVAFLVKRPGKRFPGFVSVGRAVNNDIIFAVESVSKFHAYFTSTGAAWSVTDYRSTNGSYVNGARIPANTPTPLKDGDQIRFGEHVSVAFLESVSLYAKLRS
jgi:hypothetical protein